MKNNHEQNLGAVVKGLATQNFALQQFIKKYTNVKKNDYFFVDLERMHDKLCLLYLCLLYVL